MSNINLDNNTLFIDSIRGAVSPIYISIYIYQYISIKIYIKVCTNAPTLGQTNGRKTAKAVLAKEEEYNTTLFHSDPVLSINNTQQTELKIVLQKRSS